MSVLLETSLGDIVIDLEVELCPALCENFLKLCKVYYYNLNAFFNGTYHPVAPILLSFIVVLQLPKIFSLRLGTPLPQERAVNA